MDNPQEVGLFSCGVGYIKVVVGSTFNFFVTTLFSFAVSFHMFNAPSEFGMGIFIPIHRDIHCTLVLASYLFHLKKALPIW
jgi:hypothetical protein